MARLSIAPYRLRLRRRIPFDIHQLKTGVRNPAADRRQQCRKVRRVGWVKRPLGPEVNAPLTIKLMRHQKPTTEEFAMGRVLRKEMNRINIQRVLLLILLCLLAAPLAGCSSGAQTTSPPINRDVAIMIATSNVPSNVVEESSVQTVWDTSLWTVNFMLPANQGVTKNELGWYDSPMNTFEGDGSPPPDHYRLLSFGIDRRTGAVLSRRASNSLLLGGPGSFNTEPPGPVLLPLWVAVICGVGGLVIGAVGVWSIRRRNP
jgi:hypothetical protein